jgi:hypothetical protein
MSTPHDQSERDRSAESRAPYEAPRVVSTDDFENLAMACGFAPDDSDPNCIDMAAKSG